MSNFSSEELDTFSLVRMVALKYMKIQKKSQHVVSKTHLSQRNVFFAITSIETLVMTNIETLCEGL